jgi:hypothetical protein
MKQISLFSTLLEPSMMKRLSLRLLRTEINQLTLRKIKKIHLFRGISIAKEIGSPVSFLILPIILGLSTSFKSGTIAKNVKGAQRTVLVV